MGTRMAPLLLLLLASCMAAGDTGPTAQDSGPEQPEIGPAADGTRASPSTAAGQPGGLPAIPRARPGGPQDAPAQRTSAAPGSGAAANGPGKADWKVASAGGAVVPPGAGQPAASGSGATGGAAANGPGKADWKVASAGGAVVPPGAGQSAASGSGAVASGSGKTDRKGPVDSAAVGPSGGQSPDATASGTLLPPRSGAGTGAGSTSGGPSGVVRAAAGQPAGRQAGGTTTAERNSPAGGNGAVLLPGSGVPARASGTARAPETAAAAASGGAASGVGGAAAEPGSASAADPEDEQAVALLAPVGRGIDVESLFDGDVVRYCAAMWQMGEYIGAARRRGEPFDKAIHDGVRRIASEKKLPLDKRLSFSGQVYGRLLYRLEDGHSATTFGAYVHFACLTVRGEKKIVPADPGAERKLNEGLKLCERKAVARDDLNDCLFRELTPIVERRNG